jgi:hypothetical protein
MTETGGTAPFIPDTNLLERLFLEEVPSIVDGNSVGQSGLWELE